MPENMTHIESPLEAVLGQVSAHLRGPLSSLQRALEELPPRENAAPLYRSYYRLLRLAGNLSGLEAGAGPLVNGDIVGLCRAVLDRAAYPAELLGVELAFRSERTAHIIAMDAQALEWLLLNLLSNALKFTPRGGAATLEVRVEKELVQLALSDTGQGIAPELLDMVFDRFSHPRRMDPPPCGLGLGLPICRRIAREHGGGVVLTSREGGGTTVTVSLLNRRAEAGAGAGFVTELWGGYNRTLVELSDVLPEQAFAPQFLD